MLGRLFRKQYSDRGQLANWLQMLQPLTSQQLGLPVALAAHFRNKYALTGRDFNRPSDVNQTDPEFVLRLIDEVQRLQTSGLDFMAPGLMVWAHTLRATREPVLKDLGILMWKELSRGIPFAARCAAEAAPIIGFPLDIDGHESLPQGFNQTALPPFSNR